MLSILVLLHEYGHFLIARLCRVRVNDFALGMGPTLLKWTSKRSGTNYRINLFPIGGYCAMQGEDGKSSEAQQQREFRTGQEEVAHGNFQAKTPLQRLAIVVAGPIANFIVAFAIMFVISVGFGTPVATTTVGTLQPNMPAQRIGLQPGDVIVSVDGVTMRNGDQLVETIHHAIGKDLALGVQRGDRILTLHATPLERTIGGSKVGLIGFSPKQTMHRDGFFEGAREAAVAFWGIVSMQVAMLASLVTAPGKTFSGLAGPVGIAVVSGQYQDLGWGPYLFLAAQISVSLGIFNLLPIPALDGGRGVFILAELLRGKPVDPEKEAFVHFAGFAALMVLMLFVTYHDIVRLVGGKAAL